MENVDILTQPNKLKKDLIHNQKSLKSNNRKIFLSLSRPSNKYKNIIEKSFQIKNLKKKVIKKYF